MTTSSRWTSSEVLAWSEHDGPGRAPGGTGRALWFVLAGVLSTVFAGMILTDTLCPEHRALVRTLGVVALFGTGTAIVGLVRGWAGAPVITLLSALVGVSIGVIDASHDPGRGWLIAAAFAFTVSAAGFLCLRQLTVRRWEREQLTVASSTALPALRADADEVAPTGADRRSVQPQDAR